MNVTRSIVYGVIGPCKTESSQKPVPLHPLVADTLVEWRAVCGVRTGTSDFTKVCSTSCREGWNPEKHRLAYVSSQVFDTVEKRRYRVQSYAGIVATLNSAIHVGCLHASNHASQTCSAGSCVVIGVCERREWNLSIPVIC